MPDTLPAPPPGPSLFTHRSNTPALAVAHQFADRPGLRQVLEQHLQERLLEHFPVLRLDVSRVRLATPNKRRRWEL